MASLTGLAAHSALAFDASELMALMAKVERSTVAFEETKEIAALTTPLVRRGTLRYVRPDRLEMAVDQPRFERLTIAGERLAIETRKGKQQVDLSTLPVVAAWIESLRATLSGDLAGLERYFEWQLQGERSNWKLELRPRERRLADVVDRIDIGGREAQIARIAIEERQGDRTVLVLSPLPEEKR